MTQASPHDVSIRSVAAGEHRDHAHPRRLYAADINDAKLSLLRLSALERLGGVALLLAALWGLVLWALH